MGKLLKDFLTENLNEAIADENKVKAAANSQLLGKKFNKVLDIVEAVRKGINKIGYDVWEFSLDEDGDDFGDFDNEGDNFFVILDLADLRINEFVINFKLILRVNKIITGKGVQYTAKC